jgi:hypothetical protein
MANYRLLGIKSLEKFFGAVDFNPLSTNPARLQPKLLLTRLYKVWVAAQSRLQPHYSTGFTF